MLSKMIILSYTDEQDTFYRHVRTFNKDPASFNLDECLETFRTFHNQEEIKKDNDDQNESRSE